MKNEEKNIQAEIEEISAAKEEKTVSSDTETKERNLKDEFNKLIKGEFKEIYEEKIKENLSKRFKENEVLKKELSDAKEILYAMTLRYNLDTGDVEGLKKAVLADDELIKHEAQKEGLDVKSYRHMKDLEKENKAFKEKIRNYEDEKKASATIKEWYDAADTLAKEYPEFDISAEADNPKFVDLVKKGVDLKTAFEIVHFADILSAEKEKAAENARKEATQEIMSRKARPEENGLSARSSAIIKTDVSKLSPKDRADLALRASKGEKITF